MRKRVKANLGGLPPRYSAAARTTLVALWGPVAGRNWWWTLGYGDLEDL
jgi:hypothetical protein